MNARGWNILVTRERMALSCKTSPHTVESIVLWSLKCDLLLFNCKIHSTPSLRSLI